MKKLSHALLLSFALAFVLGCDKKIEIEPDKKSDYQYTLACEFAPSFAPKNLLIVTDLDGNVLKEIEVAQTASSINETITVSLSEPDELINLHLIQDRTLPSPSTGWARVLSCYGVRNGQSVSLHDRPDVVSQPSPQKQVKVTIRDLVWPKETYFPGCPSVLVTYHPEKVELISLLPGQGMAIRLNDPQTQEKRWLIVSDEGLADSITLFSNQFTAAQKKLVIHTPSVSGLVYSISVSAVSPNLKHHVVLPTVYGGPDEVLNLDLPDGLNPDWNFYLSCSSESYVFEKVFPPNEAIHLSVPNTSINTKSEKFGHSISVKCTGPVDWLEAFSFTLPDNQHFYWVVMGDARAFESLRLPFALQEHLPANALTEAFKGHYTVRAFHSPEYGTDAMAMGLPWRSADLFAAGRQGYEVAKK